MSNIKIAIPSYKRVDKVRVFQSIPQSYSHNTYMFVRVEEEAEYRKEWGHRCNIIPITDVTGVATTMDAMVRYFGKDRVWCIDDDITLHLGVIDHKGVLRKNRDSITESEFYDCLDFIGEQIDSGYSYGQLFYPLFPRGSNYYPIKTKLTPYGSGNIFFDLSLIDVSLITYSKIGDEWCDAWVCLNLYKHGHRPVTITKYVTDPYKYNASGGCSENRLASKINECAKQVVEDFPEYCKLRTSKRKDLERLGIKDVEEIYSVSIRLK